ncbi:glycerol dehydrogenase [Clostridiales bacterium PH28_bin88]|nr:glycerol dehydrogenase [Clostridiales bacterium PH28_bin88]
MSTKIMIAPNRYVQGPGALGELGAQVKQLGNQVFITAGKTAMAQTQEAIRNSLNAEGLGVTFEVFRGECCDTEIERLKAAATNTASNVVVAVGGGKVIDAGKAVACLMNVPVVIIPTIAATDAPCSALSVIYTETGIFDRYFILPSNPDLVLVDTSIIAQAPVRFLVAGMGDALATWFEADSCAKAAAKNIPGGRTTASALSLARLCYDLLLEYGEAAKLAVEKGVATPAVEKVVEANTLLSGIGFESSGLAAAHAIHDGFTVLEETHHSYHGEKVAFGTLAHLVLEDRSTAQINEVLEFCVKVGLPVTLAEIGVTDPTPEKIMQVAEKVCEPGMMVHNMPFPVTPQMVYNAVIGADAIGCAYLAKKSK